MVEEVGARDIAAVIAGELGALTRKAGQIAEARLAAEGKGPPPCPFALLVPGYYYGRETVSLYQPQYLGRERAPAAARLSDQDQRTGRSPKVPHW
jgi:hypothetical protein